MKPEKRYQLRYAAGLYWLLDMEQPGIPYRKPVPMNRLGAQIWQMLEEGLTEGQIEERLCREYPVEPEEIHQDVQQFLEQLRSHHIYDRSGIG